MQVDTAKMKMMDQQHKDQVLGDALEENKRLKKEVQMLQKLVELNMKDLWHIADQRDWYYHRYWQLKDNK